MLFKENQINCEKEIIMDCGRRRNAWIMGNACAYAYAYTGCNDAAVGVGLHGGSSSFWIEPYQPSTAGRQAAIKLSEKRQMNEYLAWEALRFCFEGVACAIGGIVLSRVTRFSPPSPFPFPLPLRAAKTIFGG